MGSVNYIFANTGQTVRLIVQVLGSDGRPMDLDGYGNWLDGYGYLLPDGYYSDPPDGYYPDGYSDGYCDGYSSWQAEWLSCARYTTDYHEWHRWWHHHGHHHHHKHHEREPNDGYYVPVVQRVMFPDLSSAEHYPRPMTRVGVGLYAHGVGLPSGVPAIGTYISSISWTEDDGVHWETYGINAARPFGVTSVSPV
jgi:hypothetical protein